MLRAAENPDPQVQPHDLLQVTVVGRQLSLTWRITLMFVYRSESKMLADQLLMIVEHNPGYSSALSPELTF